MNSISSLLVLLVASTLVMSKNIYRRQDLSGAPECGQTCLITAATTPSLTNGCGFTDVKCLCNAPKFQQSVESCVLSSCQTNDQLAMLKWSQQTCPGMSLSPSSAGESEAPATSSTSKYAKQGNYQSSSAAQPSYSTPSSSSGYSGSSRSSPMAAFAPMVTKFMGMMKAFSPHRA